MTSYVAFLRGVNVNGINIKMAELKKAFEALGFENVRTVLASGNVRFESAASQAGLKPQIEAALRDTFGYHAWIVLLEQTQVENIARACPFPPDHAGRHAYVVLSSDPAALDELAAATDSDSASEQLSPGDGVLYWQVERGHTLDSAFAKRLARPRYKALITTRNLRTLLKLLD